MEDDNFYPSREYSYDNPDKYGCVDYADWDHQLRINPYLIAECPFNDNELKKVAIEANPMAIQYLEEPEEDLFIYALKLDPMVIILKKNLSKRVICEWVDCGYTLQELYGWNPNVEIDLKKCIKEGIFKLEDLPLELQTEELKADCLTFTASTEGMII